MHDIDILAVLVAGFVPMIVGALWYGPIFGKRWLGLMGLTEEEVAKDFDPLKTYGVSFVLALATAFVLDQLIHASGDSVLAGVHVALLAVIGFVLPSGHQSVAFEKRKTGLFWLNLGYNFVAITGQAVVLGLW